ncbi:MAG: hypothetical protein ACJ8AT_18660 [Hyalangium sp.]|uniref:hypothetical protein n=1 Tax=Hyalangium sp. TaxID=2028555 RepID=UPI00389AAA7D
MSGNCVVLAYVGFTTSCAETCTVPPPSSALLAGDTMVSAVNRGLHPFDVHAS